jgi:hypothetical protein
MEAVIKLAQIFIAVVRLIALWVNKIIDILGKAQNNVRF